MKRIPLILLGLLTALTLLSSASFAQTNYPQTGQGEVFPFGSPGQAYSPQSNPTQLNSAQPNPAASTPYYQPPTRVPFAPPQLNTTRAQSNIPPGASPGAVPTHAGLPPVSSQPIEEAQIIARINGELVQAGEVLPRINAFIKAQGAAIPASQLETVKRQAMRQYLEQIIDSKLVYADFRSTVGENYPAVEERVAEQFEKNRLPKMMESAKVNSRAELEAKLREEGSSIDAQRRTFGEQAIYHQWVGNQLKNDVTISRDQMLQYYREHLKDYEISSKVLWEELMIRFDRHPSEEAAHRKTAELGNLILSGKVSFADMAKKESQGFTAASGGRHKWTTQGSLKNTEIDKALFGLPIGSMSPIIKGETGYHIVRVVERKEAGRTPFREAQVKIKEELLKQNREAQIKAYLAKLRKGSRVWTIFEDEPQIGTRTPSGVRR